MLDEFACYRLPSYAPALEDIQPTISYSSPVETVGDTENASASTNHRKRKGNSGTTEKSTYAIFFRAQQPIVKALNPKASFGEVSKLIAAAWERVDEKSKQNLRQSVVSAKREEMRKRIALRTIQLCNSAVRPSATLA